jgi:hypothetical protein
MRSPSQKALSPADFATRENYVPRPMSGATCCACKEHTGVYSFHVIEYKMREGMQFPQGEFEVFWVIGDVLSGAFPVCVRCAPPCEQCGLAIKTPKVKAAFDSVKGRWDSERSPVTWGKGICEHEHAG